MKKVILSVMAMSVFMLAGCGGGGGGGSSAAPQEVNFYPDAKIVNDGSFIEPAQEAVVIDDESNLQLDETAVTYNSLSFTTADGTTPDIQVGQVLVGGQGETGFLRKVVSVEVNGDTVKVVTEQATLAEAFENADISITLPLLDYATDVPPEGSDLTPVSAVSKSISKTIHEKITYKPSEYATASGSIFIYDICSFNFDGSIRNKQFTSMDFKNKVLVKNEFKVEIKVPAAMAVSPKKEFPAIYNKTFIAWIGKVPVYVKAKITPVLGMNLDFKGDVNANASYVYKNLVTTGLQYDGSTLTPIYDRIAETDVPDPTFGYSGNTSAKGYVNAVVTVSFYEWAGGPGLGFDVGPYSELSASVVSASLNQPTTCSSEFTLGFEGNLKADLGAFDGLLSNEQKTWNLFNHKFAPLWSDNACPFNITPVIDSFSATPVGGNPPLDVTFNFAVSDANADEMTCSLDYDGDGNDDDNFTCTSGNYSRSYTYDAAGRYVAKLRVDDDEDGMEETAIIDVVHGPSPAEIVTFSASPTSGKEPLDVQFSYEVSDLNGDAVTCDFDFDSNGSVDHSIAGCASGMVSHTFNTAANYDATLTVSDIDGSNVGTQTIVVSSSVNTPPVIDAFSASPNPGVAPFQAAISYQVSDIDNDSLVCSVTVDGDGSIFAPISDCASGTLNATVPSAGSYALKLTVDDGVNQTTQNVTLVANTPATGSIQGTVIESGGAALQGVNVSLMFNGGEINSTLTSASGTYAFADVAVETYTLMFTKTGYSGTTVSNVSVTEGSSVTVDKALTASPTSATFTGTGEFADDEMNYWTVQSTPTFSNNGTLSGTVGGSVYLIEANDTYPLGGSFSGTWTNGSFTASGNVQILFNNMVMETIPFVYSGTITDLNAATISGTIFDGATPLSTFTGTRVGN